jgi:hypothetical protein
MTNILFYNTFVRFYNYQGEGGSPEIKPLDRRGSTQEKVCATAESPAGADIKV